MQGVLFLVPIVGVVAACMALSMSRSRYYRAQQPKAAPTPRPRPPRALSDDERAKVLATLDSDEYMDKAPAQVFAALLELGIYLCSIRTMYRVLAANDQVRERRAQRQHPTYTKPQLVATAPNQVWTWDITKLPGPTKGTYFSLYVILDLFSRYIVGWQVAATADAAMVEASFRHAVEYRARQGHPVAAGAVHHSDAGTQYTALRFAGQLAEAGFRPSIGSVGDAYDNALAETIIGLYKTELIIPGAAGRNWPGQRDVERETAEWVRWYNHERIHSSIDYLTPIEHETRYTDIVAHQGAVA